MNGIIDRIEDHYYIIELEDGSTIEIPVDESEATEGDVVVIQNNLIVGVLEEDTKKRKASIEALMNELFEE